MHRPANDNSPKYSSALARGIGLLAFWLILSAFSATALPVGILAAAVATWASLRLLPPGQFRLRPVLLGRLLMRFLYQSVLAGCDAAWRALDPRLPLRPGMVTYRSSSPAGAVRSGFCTMASLQPGLLPSGFNEDGTVIVHCLDVGQPVVSQLAGEEASLLKALGMERGHV
jgi:multicomponent Na+:H+ antiporter subunit E